MIVDSHIHLGSDKDGKCVTVENVEDVLEKSMIDRAVVLPLNEPQKNFLIANQRIVDAVQVCNKFIGGFRLDPNKNFKEVIAFASKHELKVLKLHPRAQKFEVRDAKVAGLLNYIRRTYNIPVFIHIELIPPESIQRKYICRPSDVAFLANKFSDVNFVLCHSGRPSKETLDFAKRAENVYFETSIGPLALIEDIVKSVGARKIIFGSDYPYSHPAIETGKIKLLGLSAVEERLIFRGNIERLIRCGLD